MKRGNILSIIIIILILISGVLVIKQNLIKDDKDLQGELAETSPQPQDISIFVLPAVPILTIISPENKTYSNTQILLNYSADYAETIWYNLDNINNITINSSVDFITSEGPHTLYLYANNTQGTSAKSVSFSIDLTQPPEEPPAPPSGGGGTRTLEIPIIINNSLILNKDKIEVTLKQGETKKETLTLENVGESKLNISLQRIGLEEFLSISETSFELAVGELKIISLDFTAKQDSVPDSYTGKLILKTKEIEKEILISLEIKSEKETETPKKFSTKNIILIIISIIVVLLIILIILIILYELRKSRELKKSKKYLKAKLKRLKKKY